MLDRQVTLGQHAELLSLAGWLAALVGCVEYDSANPGAAEATRQAAWKLGEETGKGEVMAWAQEMRARFALTRGDYRGVIAAADTGHAVAPNGSAAVQLHAQKAKAWARLGDRRQVEVALDQGRALLERMPHPENLDNHFAVDPAKWTRWTATASSAASTPAAPRASSRPPTPPKSSASGSTRPEPSGPPCATPKHGSSSASSPPAKATSNAPSGALMVIGNASLCDLAARLHERDRRQREPYVNHLLRVCVRIIAHYRVSDPDLACAALLHDAVEDHAKDHAWSGTVDDALEALAGQFGRRVADLVGAVTNPQFPPDRDTHEQYANMSSPAWRQAQQRG